jgi:GABA permease
VSDHLLSWAIVIAFYFANKWFISRRPIVEGAVATTKPHRVLVMANETANSAELLDELRRIGADSAASYYVVVPASPIETGVTATHGPLDVMEATHEAAKARLDYTLSCVRRTWRPTADWVTTGRCGRWPMPWTRSTRIRS